MRTRQETAFLPPSAPPTLESAFAGDLMGLPNQVITISVRVTTVSENCSMEIVSLGFVLPFLESVLRLAII